jgi:RNA polymerase sigma-70 factor, ECF subfamily
MAPEGDTKNVTRLLREWAGGSPAALDELVPLIYGTLRRLAAARLRHERNAATLEPTALVHEAYVRMIQQNAPDWESRAQFFGIAVRVMRQVLVDHARERLAEKRGGGAVKLELDEALGVPDGKAGGLDVLALNRALDELQQFDERKSRMIELRYFGGFTEEETGRMTGVSLATVRRELRRAEAWLHARMSPPPAAGVQP